MRIAIIGFGAFGQLAARRLQGSCEIVVHDTSTARLALARKTGLKTASLREACASDAVVFCVPISALQPALKQARKLLKPGTLVLDVCSVKVLPCRLMKRLLPQGVEAIGTHPLFGPQSAAEGINELQIIICPIRASKQTLENLKSILSKLGLKVAVMTPSQHDRLMAQTQAISHFVAKALERTGFAGRKTGLASVRKMQEATEILQKDSPRLFRDLQKLNPFAGRARKKLLAELNAIERGLE